MRFELDRTTGVLVIFVIVIVAIFGINQFVQSQPPLEITVVVDPLAEDWITEAVQDYNSNNVIIANSVRVQVNLQIADDLEIWRGNSGWNSQNHPDAWIPSSSQSLAYAPSSLPFEVVNESLVYTPLVWGGFQNRVDVITENGTRPFDWKAVQAIADNSSWTDGAFVNMAINWANSSMAGVGALTTATASYRQDTNVTRSLLSDASFISWFAPIRESVLNSERLGGNPAQSMASRGASAADFALLPESQWLTELDSLTANNRDFVFSYPAYQYPLDFPIALWSDAQTTNNERSAVQNFASFLANEAQGIALEHGLRPSNSSLTSNATLFTQAESYGILLEMPASQTVTVDRGTADAIILLPE